MSRSMLRSADSACSCILSPLELTFIYYCRNILVRASAFDSVEKFANAIRIEFGSAFVVNGAIQKSDLTDYYLFLKNAYVLNGPHRVYKPEKFFGYMGDDYWYLSKEVSEQNFLISLFNFQNTLSCIHKIHTLLHENQEISIEAGCS